MCASCAASDVSGKVSCDRKAGINANGIRIGIGLNWIGSNSFEIRTLYAKLYSINPYDTKSNCAKTN